ncbi:unnamed protein product [Lathyrus oleraceus]
MLSLVLLLAICLILPLLIFFRKHKTTKHFPPGPKGLPIIGNLHQLDLLNISVQLADFSKIYGPIFSLKLGSRQAIVVSSSEIAKEIFKKNDHTFSDRPQLYSQQKLSYNGSEVLFSQYNESWRDIRKICVIHIFSSIRVAYYSSIRNFEVRKLIKKISENANSSSVTNMSEVLISLASSLICNIAFGKTFENEGPESSSRFPEMLHEFQALLAETFVADYIPFTGWIDKARGLHGRLDKIYKEFDKFYQEIIDEHLDPNREHGDEEVIVDVLLRLKKERSLPFDITFDLIKGVLMDMLVAATDTSSATLIWFMLALIKNPRVMKKVQEEIRSVGRKKDFINEDDIKNFPYLKAAIKETLRMNLPSPLLVQREAREKCTLSGYEIPAKTILYVNAWAIQRDPNFWKNPDEFYPERFLESSLESSINFTGQDFELIPFGAGRRICPGITMGVAFLELVLANLLYAFDWGLPDGLKKEDIDYEMLPGITQHKKNPLCLVAKIPM